MIDKQKWVFVKKKRKKRKTHIEQSLPEQSYIETDSYDFFLLL